MRKSGSKRDTGTDEFVGFVRRIVRAHGRRVADNDIAALGALAAVRAEVDDVIAAAVLTLHDEHGYSWAAIGAELGVTREAAFQRYARRAS